MHRYTNSWSDSYTDGQGDSYIPRPIPNFFAGGIDKALIYKVNIFVKLRPIMAWIRNLNLRQTLMLRNYLLA